MQWAPTCLATDSSPSKVICSPSLPCWLRKELEKPHSMGKRLFEEEEASTVSWRQTLLFTFCIKEMTAGINTTWEPAAQAERPDMSPSSSQPSESCEHGQTPPATWGPALGNTVL